MLQTSAPMVAATLVGFIIVVGAIVLALITMRDRGTRVATVVAVTRQCHRELAEAMPHIAWTARADGSVDFVNQRWAEYTGRNAGEISNAAWREVVHPDDAPSAHARWAAAVFAGETCDIEYRLRRGADAAYRWHVGHAVPLRGIDGSVVRWFGTCTDIDDQRRTEDFLRSQQIIIEQREAELERATAVCALLSESMADMVSVHGADGAFEHATPGWSEYLGCDPINLFPAAMSHPDDVQRLTANHQLALRSAEPITTVWRCRRADGSYGPLQTRTRAVYRAGTSHVVAFVCTSRDVSLKKLTDARRDARSRWCMTRYRKQRTMPSAGWPNFLRDNACARAQVLAFPRSYNNRGVLSLVNVSRGRP